MAWVPWVALEGSGGEMTEEVIVVEMLQLATGVKIPEVLKANWILLAKVVGG
jgi:hypothetical protein